MALAPVTTIPLVGYGFNCYLWNHGGGLEERLSNMSSTALAYGHVRHTHALADRQAWNILSNGDHLRMSHSALQ